MRRITDTEVDAAAELLERSHDGGIVFVIPRGMLRRVLELEYPIERLRGRWLADTKCTYLAPVSRP